MILKAFIHLLQQRHGINLVDFVGEWFWDGDQGALSSLTRFFPDACGHLCLEHAKRNAEKRFKDGYKKVVGNVFEFDAFTTPGAFTVSVDLFLQSLLDGNQDTVYLTTAHQGGTFISENGSWSAPWRSSFYECYPGFQHLRHKLLES